mgnify:CR=1 FL=1
MELTQLYYFRTVARLQHYTHAAEELHITQPTLSKTISRLEEELGTNLFDRKGNSVQLNACGRAFLTQVDYIFSHLDYGKLQISEMLNPDTGNVSVAVTVREMLDPFLNVYIRRHPDTHIHITASSAADIKPMLEDHTVDFAITIQPIVSASVEWTPAFTEELGLIMSVNHPLASCQSVELAQMKNERFFMHNAFSDLTDMFYGFCESVGFSPNVIFEGDNYNLITNFVADNMGISMGSRRRFMEQNERKSTDPLAGCLVFMPVSDANCSRTIGFARLREFTLAPSALQLYDFLLYCLKNSYVPGS